MFVVCVTASRLEKLRTMEQRSKIHDKMKQILHKHGGDSGYRKVSYTTVESTLASWYILLDIMHYWQGTECFPVSKVAGFFCIAIQRIFPFLANWILIINSAPLWMTVRCQREGKEKSSRCEVGNLISFCRFSHEVFPLFSYTLSPFTSGPGDGNLRVFPLPPLCSLFSSHKLFPALTGTQFFTRPPLWCQVQIVIASFCGGLTLENFCVIFRCLFSQRNQIYSIFCLISLRSAINGILENVLSTGIGITYRTRMPSICLSSQLQLSILNCHPYRSLTYSTWSTLV